MATQNRYEWIQLWGDSAPIAGSHRSSLADQLVGLNELLDRGYEPVREVQVQPGTVLMLLRRPAPAAEGDEGLTIGDLELHEPSIKGDDLPDS